MERHHPGTLRLLRARTVTFAFGPFWPLSFCTVAVERPQATNSNAEIRRAVAPGNRIVKTTRDADSRRSAGAT